MNKLPSIGHVFMACYMCVVMLVVGTLVMRQEAVAAPDYRHIVGDWQSNYGPVHVDFVRGERSEGSAIVKGYWLEPPGNKRGKIEVGHYDAKTGELALEYEETWTKHKGKIKLVLDSSGKKFTGAFKSDDGSTGTWSWKRQ